jgi:hypothetical protein
MIKIGSLVMGVALAIGAGMLAPLLVFLAGFLACRVLAAISGDDNYMNFMWYVFALALLAGPVCVAGSLILYGYRSSQQQAAQDRGGRSFAVGRRGDMTEQSLASDSDPVRSQDRTHLQ